MRRKQKRIIIISIIVLVLVIVATILTIFLVRNNKEENQEIRINIQELENNFNTIFTNAIYPETEENSSKVSLEYDIKVSENGKYDIDINIPNIKIDTNIVSNINNDIFNSFIKPISEIIGKERQYTIYDADYVAYINNNILSVVIKCNLKEGSKPQRVIVRTYNYNMENNEILTLQEAMNMKNLNQDEVQSKILEKINIEIEKVAAIQDSGYNVYKRDINNVKYNLKNTTEFFLGENNTMYIVYPYGNTDFTSELDLIICE